MHLISCRRAGLMVFRAAPVNSTRALLWVTSAFMELALRLALRVRALWAHSTKACCSGKVLRKLESGRICFAGPRALWLLTICAALLTLFSCSCNHPMGPRSTAFRMVRSGTCKGRACRASDVAQSGIQGPHLFHGFTGQTHLSRWRTCRRLTCARCSVK